VTQFVSKPLRIFHFVESLAADTGGPSRTVPRLALALSSLGHRVEVGVMDHPSQSISSEGCDLLASDKVVVTRFDAGGRRLALQLHERVRSADVVNVHGLWNPANHVACVAARELEVPLVVSPRGMLERWAFQRKSLKKRIGWWTYQRRDLRCATVVHATSRQEYGSVERLGVNSSVAMVPNGVDPPPTGIANGALPPRSILFLSRVDPKKGIPLLIDAAARIREPLRADGWRILVVGPGDPRYIERLRRTANAAGVSDLFEFRPAVHGTEKWSLLGSAELFVLPSFSENFGVVVGEALASGTPVVTTTGTPWSEVQTSGCGWWVETDAGSISEALLCAIRLTGEQRRAMGDRGRTLIQQRYNWEQIARAMSELYEGAIALRTFPKPRAFSSRAS